MFGILFGIVDLIGKTVFNINMESAKQQNRCRAIKNGFDTYYDNRGGEWYIQPDGKDIRCSRRKNFDNGHELLVCTSDHKKVIRDYTEEKERKEDNEFCKKYNDAMAQARLDGKAYFCVSGLTGVDKRYGFYELDTEKYYELSKEITYYFIHYYNVTKNTKKYIDCRRITKDDFLKYGGHMAMKRGG